MARLEIDGWLVQTHGDGTVNASKGGAMVKLGSMADRTAVDPPVPRVPIEHFPADAEAFKALCDGTTKGFAAAIKFAERAGYSVGLSDLPVVGSKWSAKVPTSDAWRSE